MFEVHGGDGSDELSSGKAARIALRQAAPPAVDKLAWATFARYSELHLCRRRIGCVAVDGRCPDGKKYKCWLLGGEKFRFATMAEASAFLWRLAIDWIEEIRE